MKMMYKDDVGMTNDKVDCGLAWISLMNDSSKRGCQLTLELLMCRSKILKLKLGPGGTSILGCTGCAVFQGIIIYQ